MSKSLNVKVFCRIRPENEKEKKSGCKQCVIPTSSNSVKILSDIKSDNNKANQPSSQEFTFDTIFPQDSKQIDIFEQTAKPLISSAMQGINGTLFCYGQTSSGKTFTMEGIKEDYNLKGIIPRMMEYIFELIPQASSDLEFSVKCQYYQIYNEKIQDLLDTRKTDLSIREDKTRGIWVEDCTEIYVSSKEEMYDVFQCGSNNRTVSATEMNKGSSRSHSLFSVTIFQRNNVTGSTQTGKLYFVDLAGSEKMSKTGIEGGMGLKEAQNINKSLMTLGMVINALTEGASHIPYRDSKLTRVLQESLGGNSQTTLIITCSPNFINQSESLSTLRFGQRAKLIKNKVSANTERSAKELLIKLNKANERIKQLESIIGNFEKGHSIISLSKEGGKEERKECEECAKFEKTIAYLNIELLTAQEEYDDVLKEKEDLELEIKEKSKEIYLLNEKIEISQNSVKILSEEQNKILNELQLHMETFLIFVKKIQNSIEIFKSTYIKDDTNEEVNLVEDYLALSVKNWNEFLSIAGLEISLSNNPNNTINNRQNNNSICDLSDRSADLSNRSTEMINNINVDMNKNINIQIQSNQKRRNTINYHKRRQTFIKNRNQNIAIVELTEKLKKANFVLSLTKDKLLKSQLDNSQKEVLITHQTEEIQSLDKKIKDYEDSLKELKEKLIKKEGEFKEYQEKSMIEFTYKEKKQIELINRISDLEDEYYKLLYFNKNENDNKKFVKMDRQIKSFSKEMQRIMKENEKYKQTILQKEIEINKLKIEIEDLQKEKDISYEEHSESTLNNNNFDNIEIESPILRNTPINPSIKITNLGEYLRNKAKKDEMGISSNEEKSTDRKSGAISRNRNEFKKDNKESSLEVIQSSKVIKMIRGGNRRNTGFFNSILNNGLRMDSFNAIQNMNERIKNDNYRETQFEKEMNLLYDDNISEI